MGFLLGLHDIRRFTFGLGIRWGSCYFRGRILYFMQNDMGVNEAVQIEIIDKLKKAMVDRDMVATGAMLKSIRFETTELLQQTTVNIYALDYIGDLEFGVEPERRPPPTIEALTTWAKAKDLDLNPYAVQNAIIAKGTIAYQIGGTNIVSDTINTESFNRVVELASSEIKLKIKKQWQLLFSNNR
jgi:hypothetical protein